MIKALLVIALFLLAYVCCDIFEHSVLDWQGNPVDLKQYKDAKAILIVNVASNCGFTYTNYRELNDLYKKYHSQGLEILAFPSNQFGEQEPGSNDEIQTFVHNYGVQFPVFGKIDVNGPTAHPLYQYLKDDSDHAELGWNFVKFLVVGGVPVGRYQSRISPKKIEPDILQYLNQQDL